MAPLQPSLFTVLRSAPLLFSLVVACGGADSLEVLPGGDGGGGGSGGGGSAGSRAGGVSTDVGGQTVTTTTDVGVGGDFGFGGGPVTVTVGVGGVGGATSGAGGSTFSCIPGQAIGCSCASGNSGAQICLPNGTYGACVCSSVDGGSWEQQELARIRKGIVGTWVGLQSNPWQDPCTTTMAFFASGQYAAHSPGERCVVLYYGTNADSPEKTYVLNDVLASGEGSGDIQIYFGPGDTNRGTLRHLVLSQDENQLDFEFWNDQYGPVVFTLKRLTR